MNIQKHSWEDIHSLQLTDTTILLDIDGVLMAHGENVIATEIINHIEHLKKSNDIFIVSNTLHKDRCTHIASASHITCVDSPYKKPSKGILNYIEYDHNKPFVVIGDKVITDGLFAWRIGASFILMNRRVSQNDHWLIKLIYKVDDIVRIVIQKYIS